MPNNNLADISTFENLQNQANQMKVFCSQMSEFNELGDVQKMKIVSDIYIKALDDAIRQYRKYENIKKDIENEWNQIMIILEGVQKNYDDVARTVQDSLALRAKAASDAKAKGDEKLLSEYEQDYAAVLDMWRKVFQKEKLS
jgi:hypothetical protein